MLRILEHEADLEADLARELHVLPNINAVNDDLTAVRLEDSVKMLNEGAFTGAGVSDNSDQFALFYIKIYIVNRL